MINNQTNTVTQAELDEIFDALHARGYRQVDIASGGTVFLAPYGRVLINNRVRITAITFSSYPKSNEPKFYITLQAA